MKNLMCIIAIFLGIQFAAQAQKTQEVRIKTSAVCSMCKSNIETALTYEKGVKSAYLDMKTKEAVIVFNAKKTSVTALKTAINKAGYDADDQQANPDAYKSLNPCCKKEAGEH